jgi:hypothetical protein
MRILIALAAAPFALTLAACDNDSEVPDDRIVDTPEAGPNEVDVNLPNVPVEYPEVAVNARETVDYAGDYSQTLPDGRSRTLTLGRDDTYTFRDESGAESRGTYNWYSDNSRILIRRDGANEVYAIADGALYRMTDENAPTTGRKTAEQTYRRVVGPGGQMGASSGVEGRAQAAPAQ